VPHIDLPPDLPGITALLAFRPSTAKPLMELAEVLLRSDNSLTRGERELIAAYVSNLNEYRFCDASHSAFAAKQLDGGADLVGAVKHDPATAPVTPKLRALLAIAAKVVPGGRSMSETDVAGARDAGATDEEIHDAVLIAAAFCMFNRYVDGLGTSAPDEPGAYAAVAELIVQDGYARPR
jgi:uncharacterized peroxidase-related enzyme